MDFVLEGKTVRVTRIAGEKLSKYYGDPYIEHNRIMSKKILRSDKPLLEELFVATVYLDGTLFNYGGHPFTVELVPEPEPVSRVFRFFVGETFYKVTVSGEKEDFEDYQLFISEPAPDNLYVFTILAKKGSGGDENLWVATYYTSCGIEGFYVHKSQPFTATVEVA